LAFSAWLGRFCGALVTYYNLDVKEGAPELAISGTFKTIKGLADVANVQSAPPLPIIKKGRSLKEGLAYFFDWLSAADLNLRGEQVQPQAPRCVASAKAPRPTSLRSSKGEILPHYHEN
jgi:hypothetical protein